MQICNNIQSLVLLNIDNEQFIYKFYKLLLNDSDQFILISRNESLFCFRVHCFEDKMSLQSISSEESSRIEELLANIQEITFESGPPKTYRVVGFSYNHFESSLSSQTKFKISNNNQPINILPYIMQTGADNIIFV